MKKTKKAYETHLNELYGDMYSQSEAIDNFAYLTNRSRGKATNMNCINAAYANHELGSLLRKFDPVAFDTGFNEWK